MANGIKVFGLFSVAALAGVIACSTTTTTTDSTPADAGTSTKDSGSTKKDSGTTEEVDAGDTQPTGDDACKAEKTLDDCVTCCDNNHETGVQTLVTAWVACACKGTGSAADGGAAACAKECATSVCAATPKNPTSGDACSTCLQAALDQDGACYEAVSKACSADTDCVADNECANTQCDGKK